MRDSMTPLQLAEDNELIDELANRGVACVIAFVCQDGEMMKQHVHQLKLVVGGRTDIALWAAANLLEKTLVHATDAGCDDEDVENLVSNIVYDEDADPERQDREDSED